MRGRTGDLAFGLAVLLLSLHPARWLAGTWFDGGYGSDGEWVFLLVVGLALWSLSSPRVAPAGVSRRRLVHLFLATALVRLAGELLAIHALGALALAVDVYALARLVGLDVRARRLAPAPLALLFAFSLPIERLIQRALGFPLQLVSARVACAASGALHPGLSCDGVLVRAPGAELAIDLPCSGARGLVLLAATTLALAALRRLPGQRLPLALLAVPALALAANVLRVAALIEGVLSRPLGLDVMVEPWHSLSGLAPLALATLALSRLAAADLPLIQGPGTVHPAAPTPAALGLGLLAAAGAVLAAPQRPLDVSGAVAPLRLPLALGPWQGELLPLSPQERAYFTAFGGQAEKRSYRGRDGVERTLIAVRTRSPLRHLHPPDECLIGRGHRVQRRGIHPAGWAPSAIYRSEDPAGRAWRVEVSWVADDGQVASSVAEIAWLSLRAPGRAWTMLERISPWDACQRDPTGCARFQEAAGRALELSPGGAPPDRTATVTPVLARAGEEEER